MTAPLKLGLVGLGKIARDQHLSAIAATEGAVLAAVADPHSRSDSVPSYPGIEQMLAAEPELDAVIMCQPPQVRFAAARAALLAGKHVFLEKPPGVTVCEVEALQAMARDMGVTLFASWHSRYAPAVAPARDWLKSRTLRSAAITWKEDVRHWHPGQDWIFAAGGFGIFDPGINALSILTGVVAEPLLVRSAVLQTPANRQAPIAADLELQAAGGAGVTAALDFRQTGPQTWDIELICEEGRARLSEGGSRLFIDGAEQAVPGHSEYPTMYRHFVELVRSGQSDVDLAPLRLVADAFLCASTRQVEAFEF